MSVRLARRELPDAASDVVRDDRRAPAALSITLISTAAFLLGEGARDSGASRNALYIVVLVLLAAAMLRTYLKRGESEPPKWMSKLGIATTRESLRRHHRRTAAE